MPIVELSRVCRMDRRTISAADAINSGRTFVGMEHVDPVTGRISLGSGARTGDGKSQAFLFDSRHILFGKLRPYLRKIAIPQIKGCSSTELIPLLPDPNQLDRTYLFYWIRRQQVIDTLMAKNTGARMPRADMSVLLGMSLPLPPLEEQRRIVGLLDRAAEIRRRADAARAKARAIIPALFLDTFGDPATNPRGWPVMTVGGLPGIELRNGISPSKSGKLIGNVLTLSAITRGSFDPCARKESTFAASLVEDQAVSRSLFLICRGNGNRHLVGQGAFPTCDMPGVAFPDTMIALRVTGSEILPAYLTAVWSSSHVRAQIDAAAKTTNGTFKISQGAIMRFAFPVPPRELQTAFAKQAQRLESLARHLDAAAAKADAMAAGLSAEVFDSPVLPARRNAA